MKIAFSFIIAFLLMFNFLAAAWGVMDGIYNYRFQVSIYCNKYSRFTTYVVPGYQLGCVISDPVHRGLKWLGEPVEEAR